MSQEINLRLKADTKEAVKSVRDLEKQVAGLENLQSKGEADKNFLSQDDVKRFRRMASDAEKVYRDFFERYNRIQRDFEKKKEELSSARAGNANQETIDRLQGELGMLNNRRNAYANRADDMTWAHNKQRQAASAIQGMNTPGMLNDALLFSRRFLPMLGITLGAGALAGYTKTGMDNIKSEEEMLAMLGQRISGYNGRYEDARKDATGVGLADGNAFTASATAQTADTYTRLAGAKSKDDMWKAANEIQSASRIMGVDTDELGQSYGRLGRLGATNPNNMRGFRDAMIGAIKETGLAGRESEFVNALTGLSDTVSQGQLELNPDQLKQMIGLQTILGRTGEKGLQGQQGANLLSQIDSSIKGGDNRMDLLLGWGTQYQGIEGRAELERNKVKGLTDPDVVRKLFRSIDGMGGGNKDYQALMLKDVLNISMEQADRLLQDDVWGQLMNGELSSKEIEEIMKGGAEEAQKKQGDWTGSKSQRRSENEAKNENLQKYIGETIDNVWQRMKEIFFSQPESVQTAELVSAAGFGSFGLARMIGKLGSSPIGKGGGGGLFKSIPGMFKDGGLKNMKMPGGASKVLGPLGSLLAFDWASGFGTDMGDWLFGHEAGQEKLKKGIFKNPFSDPFEGTHETDRQGALSKLWGAVTPWESATEKKWKAKEEERAKSKQEELLMKETENINQRKDLNTADNARLDKERRYLDEMKTVTGSELGNSSSSGGAAGILGKIFGNFSSAASMFGLGSTSGSSYSNSGVASGSKAEYRNMSLKGNAGLTAADVNRWIDSKAPAGSLMRGKGDTFLRAAEESGLDVRYLVAHAAHETGWGTSNIAKKKSNFYGIGAFDASPYASSYGYNNADAGIIEGAKWISKNYVNKGQDTLYKMRNNGGVHEYATDKLWDSKIAGIMASAPSGGPAFASATSGTNTLNVVVSGGVEGLTKENNNKVASAISSSLKSNNVQLAYEFRQGIGGNR